jgi:hypothetical protein
VQEFVAWWADNGNRTERHPVLITSTAAARAPAPATPATPTERPVGDSAIEIHPIRRDVVCAVLDYAGCRVRHVEPDGLAGPGWLSYTYVAQASQPPS